MFELIEYRKKAGLSQQNLADMLGVSRSAVSMWEIRQTVPRPSLMHKLADALSVPVKTVTGWFGMSGKEGITTFPVIGEVNAGFQGAQAEMIYTEDTITIPDDWLRGVPASEYFVLQALGDSMEPDILSGDLLLVRCMSYVNNADTAIVILPDGVGTVKKVYFDTDRAAVVLKARNPKYAPVTLTGEMLENFRIQGLVVTVIRGQH